MLEWLAPRQNGGAPVKSYIIEKLENKGGNWRTAADTGYATNSCVVKDLIEGREYQFRIRAKNSEGVGEPAELKQSIKPTKPVGESRFFILNVSP